MRVHPRGARRLRDRPRLGLQRHGASERARVPRRFARHRGGQGELVHHRRHGPRVSRLHAGRLLRGRRGRLRGLPAVPGGGVDRRHGRGGAAARGRARLTGNDAGPQVRRLRELREVAGGSRDVELRRGFGEVGAGTHGLEGRRPTFPEHGPVGASRTGAKAIPCGGEVEEEEREEEVLRPGGGGPADGVHERGGVPEAGREARVEVADGHCDEDGLHQLRPRLPQPDVGRDAHWQGPRGVRPAAGVHPDLLRGARLRGPLPGRDRRGGQVRCPGGAVRLGDRRGGARAARGRL
mmetsp:Transcript_62360/g.193269  ORF Transcript_62360/g.193269 Transcript_62360/m.193269 type:complete len:294 (+) Transcript_62360:637-1518(+)